jgi:CheY-like chemotaxis protein
MSPRGRIAVIDDDAVLARLLSELLADEGFEVTMGENWQGACELVEREQPDVVLLHVRLGGADQGWCVLDQLALHPATRRIPVILCSGACVALQAHDPEHGVFVAPKPFDIVMLLETVALALETERVVAGLQKTP